MQYEYFYGAQAEQFSFYRMIATKTNLEITEYREKFFLGLSLRQLACFAAAAVLAIATCFVCLHWLRMDILCSSRRAGSALSRLSSALP